jgi:hypothetical protein
MLEASLKELHILAKIPAEIDEGVSLKFDGVNTLKAMLSYRHDEENKPAQKFYRIAFRELLALDLREKILFFDETTISGK